MHFLQMPEDLGLNFLLRIAPHAHKKAKLQSNANYDIRFLLVRLLVVLSYFPLFIPRYKILFSTEPASLPVLVFTSQVIFFQPMTFATPIDIKTAPKENSAPILAAS